MYLSMYMHVCMTCGMYMYWCRNGVLDLLLAVALIIVGTAVNLGASRVDGLLHRLPTAPGPGGPAPRHAIALTCG